MGKLRKRVAICDVSGIGMNLYSSEEVLAHLLFGAVHGDPRVRAMLPQILIASLSHRQQAELDDDARQREIG